MDNNVAQKQEQTFYFQWTPEKKVDGKWIIAQKILGVKMDINIGGNPIKYEQRIVVSFLGASPSCRIMAEPITCRNRSLP